MFILLCPGENAPSPHPRSTPAKANCRLGHNQSQPWPRPTWPQGWLQPMLWYKSALVKASSVPTLSKPAPNILHDFPREMGAISRGKICAFSGVRPAHLDGGEGVEKQPLANPGLTTKRRKHTTLRLTETLPGPACFQPQNCVLIQTLSCLSGKRIARHALVIANPDITPSALERLPITSPLVNSRYYSHGPNTLPRNLTTLASSTQLHRACKLQIATTSTT